MIQKGGWHFNMPKKLKDILDVLIEKSKTKSCVDTQEVVELRNKVSWTNLPNVVDDALELIGVSTERTDRTLPKWKTTPSRIEALNYNVDNLDCRSITVSESNGEEVNISSIILVEYDSEEDLTGENEKVDFTVYFEDKSGDETPNIGKKLFLDEKMLKPLVGYKGAFYFIRPSQPDEKVTMLVRGTGTVKKTKFEV